MTDLTPREIVSELDRFIIGQKDAKRAVAVALTLFDARSFGALVTLIGFLALMALLAVVIDRRSFLVAVVGYVVALAITIVQGQAFFVILILGAGLVLLGAQWEALRRCVMRALPSFPGKDRLPPYDLIQQESAS